MKSTFLIKSIAIGLITSAMAMQVQAHKAWIVPSSTILSGDSSYVTFDAAVSNTIFFIDHNALNIEGLTAIDPKGNKVELLNPAKGKLRSTFDLELTAQGTYKISTSSGGLRARWEDKDGKRSRWPRRGQTASEADFAKAVPKNAKKLEVSHGYRRVETFVTLGAPDNAVFKPTNEGLEMVPLTHPNDLFVGEEARFTLLMSGKPAKGASIEIIPEGVRYRDQQNSIKVIANANGEFAITWPTAGRYFIEAEYQDDQAAAPATKRSGSYVAVLEVLPM